LGYEDHIDVTEVVQFSCSALAHTDDRQFGLLRCRANLGSSNRQGRLQCRIGEIREGFRNILESCRAIVASHEIASRERDKMPSVLDSQRVKNLRRVRPSNRLCRSRIGAYRTKQRVPDDSGRWTLITRL
jgi:hypothetical protein